MAETTQLPKRFRYDRRVLGAMEVVKDLLLSGAIPSLAVGSVQGELNIGVIITSALIILRALLGYIIDRAEAIEDLPIKLTHTTTITTDEQPTN
jgi:hypothetical protein